MWAVEKGRDDIMGEILKIGVNIEAQNKVRG